MGVLGLSAAFAQGVVGQHERRSRRKHRIDQQQHLALQVAARYVLHLHLELAVLRALAVGRHEGVLRVVEVVQETLVEGQSRTQDRGQHHAVGDHRHRSLAQGRLHDPLLVVEGFRYLVGRDLADAFEVAAETHRIGVDPLVADFGDELAENGIFAAERMDCHG